MTKTQNIVVTYVSSQKDLRTFVHKAECIAIAPPISGVENYLSLQGFDRVAIIGGAFEADFDNLLRNIEKVEKFALINFKLSEKQVQDLVVRSPGLKDLLLHNTGLDSRLEFTKTLLPSLTNLTSLHLSRYEVGDAGAEAIAQNLTNLTSLDLSRNEVGDAGAEAIAQNLTNLTSLYLSYNEVGDAGASAILGKYQGHNLSILNLTSNPCVDTVLTKEAFDTSDARALLAAWARFKTAATAGTLVPLNEAKLLVLGNEAVGKTSLVKFLIDNTPRDPDERKTPNIRHFERINTQGWIPENSEIRLNVWDFGGQEIMRGTHRFFLTERSLYLVVLEDRREDDESVDTWLRMIKILAGDVPILVVINKSDGGKAALQLDETRLQREHPQVLGFHRMSCDDDDYSRQQAGLLRAAIGDALASHSAFDAARKPQPASWLAVKDELTRRAKEDSVLEASVFNEICLDASVVDDHPVDSEDERRALLRTLHAMGVIVAHGLDRDAPAALKGITLLDPNWLTDAIYAVLDRIKSDERGGRFARVDLSTWLEPGVYPVEHHEFIISMMLDSKVELCYRLPDEEETFLAPEALRVKSPDYSAFEEDALRFRYRYEDLPRALIPRLIVRVNRLLRDPDDAWLTGAKLYIDKAEAVIRADREAKQVDIAVKGQRCREALAVLREAFDSVHGTLGDLGATAWTPMPDNPSVEESYDFLLRLEREEGADYRHRPTNANHSYTVGELLDLFDRKRAETGSQENQTNLKPPPKGGNDTSKKSTKNLLGFANIFPFVTACVTALAFSQSLNAPYWLIAIGAVIVYGTTRMVLRLFDRDFFFRRLLLSWGVLGGSMFAVGGIGLALDLEWIQASYGVEYKTITAVLWVVVMLALILVAFWEAKNTGE
ncbi:MAG: COR domain-containing protein [Paracoccaceae bacterium]